MTRASHKQDRVLQSIRREILQGRFREAQQLPSQAELARRHKVSLVTVGLAINRLAREGFIEPRHGSGTYVVDRLPHKNNIALVFWNDPSSRFAAGEWSRYHSALSAEARVINQEQGRNILPFYGINQHTDSEDRQRLLSYIEAHRLAGIIFAHFPIYLDGTPILDEPGIARVALMGEDDRSDLRSVEFDGEGWLEKAFDYFAKLGRKRVALVRLGRSHEDKIITRLAAQHGIEIPEYWRQEIPIVNASAVRKCVRLLMYGAGAQRPDALLITDDNFVEDAQAALVDAGVRVPDDVAVVAHCNFPWPPARVLPVQRLGFDVGRALRTCVDLIDRQRQGASTPKVTTIPAQFEHELATAADATLAPR